MSIEAPSNGIYTVLGEINLLLASLKKSQKYGAAHYVCASKFLLIKNNKQLIFFLLHRNKRKIHWPRTCMISKRYWMTTLVINNAFILIRLFWWIEYILIEKIDFGEIDPSTFLSPFLEIIKSEETSGPVTGMALTSVDKFISYGLIRVNSETSATCVQQIADSITHARFVGTDSSSDEVVLMKILHVISICLI